MSGGVKMLQVVLILLAASVPASGTILEIGGEGAISTSPSPYGEMGLLDMGEVATATFGYVIVPTATGATLTLTVTNTSPAVLGIEAPVIPDAPVISDIFFSVPQVISGVTFISAGGTAAASSGWEFTYDPDGAPSSGFGFLKSVFDVGLEGGPDPVGLDPVIASIYDPDIYDGPGDPLASPVDFVFELTFVGGVLPPGFTSDWFIDNVVLGYPDYIGAAKFMSGADGGSGTVTNVVPEPATIVCVLGGILGAAALRRKRM